ncbi:MAG: adenosine deaminase [Elusimicrobia bacterium]|nr:adenosine deaminase [Elusimicrobiota bacterium]
MPDMPPALREAARRRRWTPEGLSRLAAALPKVETHLHLDGALSPETVRRLADADPRSPLRGLSVEEIRRKVVVDQPRASLGAVLDAFHAYYPLLRTAEAVELSAYEMIRECARQNILHAEARFAPSLQAAEGFPMEEVLAAALRGLKRGEEDFGVSGGAIICLLRPFSVVDRDANAAMAGLAARFAGRGVVGLDVADAGAGGERLSEYGRWLRDGRAAGLGLTAHAGESPRGGEIEDALEIGVDRIGHGIILRERPDLVKELVRRGTVVEVNPTSNLRTGAVASYRDHPVRAWRDAGLLTTLSTDDPGVFGIDLVHEYEALSRDAGFSAEELVELAWNGVWSLFLPEARRRELAVRFELGAAAALDKS